MNRAFPTIGGGGNYLISKELEPKNEISKTNDNLHVDVEEINEETPENEQNLKSNTDKNLSAKTISYLNNGAKVRMILLDSEGNYLKHVDNTVGKPTKPLMISRGVTYTIVIFSFNSSYLPDLSGLSKTYEKTIDDPHTHNSLTKEFVYKRIDDYITNEHKNTLKVTLTHRKSQVKIKLDLTELKTFNNEEPTVSNAYLKGMSLRIASIYLSGTISRCYDVPGGADAEDVSVLLKRKSKNIYESDFVPLMISNYEFGPFKVDIKARTEHGYQEKTLESSRNISLYEGERKTFNIKVTGSTLPCKDPKATNTGEFAPCDYRKVTTTGFSRHSECNASYCKKTTRETIITLEGFPGEDSDYEIVGEYNKTDFPYTEVVEREPRVIKINQPWKWRMPVTIQEFSKSGKRLDKTYYLNYIIKVYKKGGVFEAGIDVSTDVSLWLKTR